MGGGWGGVPPILDGLTPPSQSGPTKMTLPPPSLGPTNFKNETHPLKNFLNFCCACGELFLILEVLKPVKKSLETVQNRWKQLKTVKIAKKPVNLGNFSQKNFYPPLYPPFWRKKFDPSPSQKNWPPLPKFGRPTPMIKIPSPCMY